MKRKLFLLPVVFTFFVLCGCTLAPKYTKPSSPVPSQWPTGSSYQEAVTVSPALTAPELPWREFITDNNLQIIIEAALKNNRDLKIAAVNVEKARAYYGISRAELLPSVNASGSMYKEQVPGDLSSTGSTMTTEKYSVNLGISSWEIDFFGRIRSLKDRALEQYLATQEAHRIAQISLISAVAQAYLVLAADRENLKMATSTLETQEAVYKLIHKRYDAGIISELDVKRAQIQVYAARGDVARYKQLTAQDENFLNLLTGSATTEKLLPKDLRSVSIPKDFSPGLLSDVLLLRPDILAAEHQLKAANANIGAARAAFFPRIALTTTIGTASTELSGLFKAGQGTWTFAPQIVMPIFDARTWSAYDVTKAEREISIAQYEKAIQTAFREAADALAEKSMVDQRVSAQQSLVDAIAETYRLANARYTKGIDSYLSVLDAQRSLYAAKQGLTMLQLAKVNNRIVLYKTLGGGKNN
ncbi:rnd efflux system, outer membrane lipoprotein cmec [hydrocarbon metagenome]|uniref:Rnd efflux system, outer membrane lipoprotein cmec n=1 Tax=hydrocarbon metagenome TaxID=938273 RepID=A0A0W8FSP0_9ZZZZ